MLVNSKSLKEFFSINELQLQQLTELISSPLTSLQRKIIVALVTTDVHARDIVENLMVEGVTSIHDFLW